jgi:glutamate synthase (ferredoxin)
MSEERKAFYEYHGCLMEPWDGPASIAFTDGTVIGAVLDRNGLRPSRYYVTKDGLVVMASEVGVLDIPPERVLLKERLHPGRIFLVDTAQGRIIDDAELKRTYAAQHPYGEWLKTYLKPLESLPEPPHVPEPDHETVLQRQQVFGYTHEDLRILLGPMAVNGEEPVGSMGTDTSLAVLSNRPRLLYDYFKQLFAQVTNPPLDGIREQLVTQIATTIGPEGNLLEPTPEACRQIKLSTPILDNEELARIRHVDLPAFKATNCDLPPESMMSAFASFIILYISRGVISSIMWASWPISSLIRSLSSLVDFLTLVPTSSRPASCRAATTDQDLTPPVINKTFLPAKRGL